MRAVVTGGTGFVGSYLVRELLENGYEVTVITTRSGKGQPDWSGDPRVSRILCPLNQLARMRPEEVTGGRPDVFFHLAWAGASGDARADVRLQLSNVDYACDAVRLAARIGARKYANAGSIMEYEAMQHVLKDGARLAVSGIYGIAKLTADMMSRTIASDQGLEYVNAIISNIYGVGDQSPRFLNVALRKMLRNEDLPLTLGDQAYDFIYATDACRAIRLAAERGRAGESYYIGHSVQKPLREFVLQMKKTLNSNSRLGFGEVPMNGAMLGGSKFDTCKLARELGFEPSVSFEEGILRMKRWIEETEMRP